MRKKNLPSFSIFLHTHTNTYIHTHTPLSHRRHIFPLSIENYLLGYEITLVILSVIFFISFQCLQICTICYVINKMHYCFLSHFIKSLSFNYHNFSFFCYLLLIWFKSWLICERGTTTTTKHHKNNVTQNLTIRGRHLFFCIISYSDANTS